MEITEFMSMKLGLLIDLAVIGIIAFCTWRGYRNGLIRGAFGLVALVAALFIANISAKAYSEEFTDMLKPFVGGIVESKLLDIVEEEGDIGAINSKSEYQRANVAYSILKRIGLPEVSAERVAGLAAQTEEPETIYTDIITDKLCSVLAFVAVFGIGFLLLSIVFAVIGNLIGFVFSLPGLKLIDIITGVMLGFCKGLLIVFAIATVVRYFGLVASSTLEESRILQYFVNNNIVADKLGL